MKKIVTALILATLTQIGFSQDITNPKDYSQVGEDNDLIYFLNYKGFNFPKTKEGKILFGTTLKVQKRIDGNIKYFQVFIDDLKDCVNKRGELMFYGLDNTYIKNFSWTINDWERNTNGGLSGVGISLCSEAYKQMEEEEKNQKKLIK